MQHAIRDAVAIAVQDGVQVLLARSDIDLAAAIGDRERARAGHLGEHLDREPRRQIEPLQGRSGATLGTARQADQERDQTQRHRVLKHQADLVGGKFGCAAGVGR